MPKDNTSLYSLALKAKYIDNYTVVTKLTGNKEYVLKRKVLIYNSTQGDKKSINVSLPDDWEGNVFLFSDNINVINEDTILRINTDDFYEIKSLLEKIEEEETLSLLLPLYHIETGELVRKVRGEELYQVKRNNKMSIKIEDQLYPLYDTKNCVFLINKGRAYLANENDLVKIEGTAQLISDIIEDIIMEHESK